MLSSAYQKLAAEFRFVTERNMAYGDLGGYTVTLHEKGGRRNIDVAAFFRDDTVRMQFFVELDQVKKNYGILEIRQLEEGFRVSFSGGVGGMKKLRAFVDWLIPRLRQGGAVGSEGCQHCRGQMNERPVYIQTHGITRSVHAHCLEEMQRDAAQITQERRSEKKNTGMGAFGAFLLGIISSIPWIIAYYFGWFVGWFGLLIAFGANKGYTLMGGKPCRARGWIVLAAVAFCVLFSTLASYAVYIAIEVVSPAAYLGFIDIPWLLALCFEDAEFVMGFVWDLALGYVFAGLGCWGIIKSIREEDGDFLSPSIRVLQK